MKENPLFTTSVWITFLAGVMAYTAGVTVWAYSTFPARTEIEDLKSWMVRIESKLDRSLENAKDN